MIEILVVDDQSWIRDFLGMMISEEPDMEIVGYASNAREAFGIISETKPDVVLMDQIMPGTEGTIATLQLKKKYPDLRIIMVTGVDTEAMRLEAIRVGASAFHSKSDDEGGTITALLEKIRQVAGGSYLFSAQEVIRANKRLALDLPDEEKELLRLVKSGISNVDISLQMNMAPRTLNRRLAYFYDFFGVDNKIELINALNRIGFLIQE